MKKLGNNYLIFFIILNKFTASMPFYIFINSGGSAINFINVSFATLYYFSL